MNWVIIISSSAVGYYLYIMLPYWFKQGKNTEKKNIEIPKESKPITEVKNPISDNKLKGDLFEKYIVGLFHNGGNFIVKEWRSDKIADNGLYAESSHLPDLLMAYKDSNNREHHFAIECKWRKDFYKGQIEWAKPYQIRNYIDFNRKNRVPVFVAIGVGGVPSEPEFLFVSPLSNFEDYPMLYESYIKQYKRNPNHNFFYNTKTKQLF